MITSGEPDWNDLRYFLAAARAGTLSGAARALGVRHTTISRRLTALENALGVSLVVRGPHGIEITPLGRTLLPLGDDVERAMQAMLSLVRSGSSRVRLALPTGFSPFFAERMAAFHKACPDISLELMSGSRPVDLQHGEAELAIRMGAVADDTLIVRKLCDSGWSIYASRSYLDRHRTPVDPRRLAGHEIIGFSWQPCRCPWRQVGGGARRRRDNSLSRHRDDGDAGGGAKWRRSRRHALHAGRDRTAHDTLGA